MLRLSTKLLFASVSLIVLGTTAGAGPKKTTASAPALNQDLRQIAVNESTSAGTKRAAASDAGVGNGILSLKDPGLESNLSVWKVTAGLHLESWMPEGEVPMANGQSFDFSSTRPRLMPVFSLGTSRNVLETEQWSIDLRLSGDMGYSIGGTDVVFPSGTRPSGTRLSLGLLGANLLASIRSLALPKLEYSTGLSTGTVAASHSAPDNAVNFNHQTKYLGWKLGIAYWIQPSWTIEIENAHRQVASSEPFSLPSNNLSLGTRITW